MRPREFVLPLSLASLLNWNRPQLRKRGWSTWLFGLLAGLSLTQAAAAQQIDSVFPPLQRVHEFITLRGQGFGSFAPGFSQVLFTDGNVTIAASTPYVWRQDFIQVRVPAGDLVGNQVVPIPTTALKVAVATPFGISPSQRFQVIAQNSASLSFTGMTDVQPVGPDLVDQSLFLGSPDNLNATRTKDAEVSDADGDGFPDLVDNNSDNVGNMHNPVLRLNDRNGAFKSEPLEPRDAFDTQPTATTIPAGGDFIGDTVVYDADMADLNNDRLPDVIQGGGRRGEVNRLRILINNEGGLAARFLESSSAWVPNNSFNGCPDDVDHWDLNNDGFVDVGTSLRTVFALDCRANGSPTGEALIFVNSNGQAFNPAISLSSPAGVSAHDLVFLDADDNGLTDVLLINENGASRLFINNGGNPLTFALSAQAVPAALAGASGDFNADGLADFVLVSSQTTVFLNSPSSPGSFTSGTLSGAVGGQYDVELGDVDLDGSVDIVSVAIPAIAANTVRVWLNDGSANFTNVTSPDATVLFPNIAAIQRLSGDLLDFDLDGDLDLYITGADGQDASPGPGFGRSPNQFYRNDLDPVLPPLPKADAWMRDTPTDNGSAPTPGTVLWRSPDIWNRLAPDCAPTGSSPSCTDANHQNPEFGQTNYIYAKIRNRGSSIMHLGLVEVHIGAASTGLAWPASFTKLGEVSVLSLLPGEVRDIGPLTWDPPNPSPSDHFCFYVRIVAEQDPIFPVETASVFNNVKNENGIVWRNIKVVDNLSGSSMAAAATSAKSDFIVRNVDPFEKKVDLGFETAKRILDTSKVVVHVIEDKQDLFRRWDGDGSGFERIDDLTFQIVKTKAAFKSLPMEGDEEVALSLVVEATHGFAFRVGEIVVIQSVEEGVVGGVILRIGRLVVAEPLDTQSKGSN